MRLAFLTAFACAAAISSAAQAPILWSATPTYATGTIVQGSSGNLFRAIHPSVNHNPELDGHLYWELYQVRTNTILHVGGTNSQFKLLSSAWAFLLHATIPGGFTVQISIEPATTYQETFSGELSLDHPFGSQISIVGNSNTGVVLRFPSGSNGLTLHNGHVLGGLSGLEITAPISNHGAGLYATGGAQLNSSTIKIVGFEVGAYADRMARLNCAGSIISAPYLYGVLAENHANLDCEVADISGTGAHGYGPLALPRGRGKLLPRGRLTGGGSGLVLRMADRSRNLSPCPSSLRGGEMAASYHYKRCGAFDLRWLELRQREAWTEGPHAVRPARSEARPPGVWPALRTTAGRWPRSCP